MVILFKSLWDFDIYITIYDSTLKKIDSDYKFTKEQNKGCERFKETRLWLRMAKYECSKDVDCTAIVGACDDSGLFYPCTDITFRPTNGFCIHRKGIIGIGIFLVFA